MRGAQLEQGQRQADVVVEVAGGGQHAVGRIAELRAQDRRAHFLDRGLAVAAGDAQQRDREAAAPVRCQGTEREARIGHGDQRQVGMGSGEFPGHQRAGRSTRKHVGDIGMAVELVAFQRDEELAGGDAARIGGHAAEIGVVPLRRGADGPGRLVQPHHRAPPAVRRAASANFAASRSENAWRRPAISW